MWLAWKLTYYKLAYLGNENDKLINENNELSKKLNAEMLKNDSLTEKFLSFF
jgi:hypothetical protein